MACSDTLNKFLSTTVGRDRTNRLIQYLCKLLISLGPNRFSLETLGKLTSLQSQVTNTRKVMRIFRQLEFCKLAQKASGLEDDLTRWATISKNAGLGIWLIHDSLTWAHSAKLIVLNDVKKISQRGFKFWLLALIASLLNNIHKLRNNSIKLLLEQKYLKSSVKKNDKHEIEKVKGNLQDLQVYFSKFNNYREKSNLVFATVQDSLDIFIPASNLELVNLDQSLVGLIGVLTSFMGGWTHWKSL